MILINGNSNRVSCEFFSINDLDNKITEMNNKNFGISIQ